jgi:hypothetical protein
MFFKKKKDVDLRELQKRGLIRVPKKEVEIETDRNGFVDLRNTSTTSEGSTSENSSTESNFFNFMDNTSSSLPASKQDSEKEKRETTRKFEEMDNKIYKLEQRIELLERKVGVGNSSGYSWQ